MAYELLEDDQTDSGNSAPAFGQELGRHAARQTSNLLTRGIGLTGDIFSLINDYVAKPITEYATGEKGVEYGETPLGKIIPTTEQHRKNIEPYVGEYLKPKNDVEKFADDVIEDAAFLFTPGGLLKKGAQAIQYGAKGVKTGSKLVKNLGKSLVANLLGESAKQLTHTEGAGTAAKVGSLLLLSIFDQESAAKQISKLYRESEGNLSANAKGNSAFLTKKLDSIDESISKRRPRENLSPPEKFVIDQIDKVKNLIHNGEIPIDQAIAQKRSLHKELATLYKEVPKYGDQKNVKKLANQISGALNEVIDTYGKKNPAFYKPYKKADQAFGVLAESNFVSQWVEKHVLQHPLTTGLLHVVAPATNIVGAAVLPYQITKLTYRIAKSPTLAKIYGKTVKAAAQENTVAFNKYLKELDSALQEEESKDRYEFID